MKRLAAVLLLAACSGATEPRFYLIETPEPVAEAPRAAGPLLGVREIALPLYARRPQMAVLAADGTVTASDLDRWAEEPPRAATRLLARLIGAGTGRRVAVEPWSIELDPRLLVQVEADRLLGGLGGELRFAGTIRLIDRDRPGTARAEGFDIAVPVGGEDHAALARAHGAAVAELARRIATLLR